MLTYRKKGLRFAEVWFGEPIPTSGADVVVVNQAPARPEPGALTEKRTVVLDLAVAHADRLAALGKATRYEIRRAQEKDGVVCHAWREDCGAHLGAFFRFYDAFAEAKGLPSLDRARLSRMAALGHLVLTGAQPAGGDIFIFHLYYCMGDRARLLYSASCLPFASDPSYRSMLGRANRLLHVEDMRLLSQWGFRVYDLGGYYEGTEDEAKLRINQFKSEFGGRMITEYSGMIALTFAGRLGLWARALLGRG